MSIEERQASQPSDTRPQYHFRPRQSEADYKEASESEDSDDSSSNDEFSSADKSTARPFSLQHTDATDVHNVAVDHRAAAHAATLSRSSSGAGSKRATTAGYADVRGEKRHRRRTTHAALGIPSLQQATTLPAQTVIPEGTDVSSRQAAPPSSAADAGPIRSNEAAAQQQSRPPAPITLAAASGNKAALLASAAAHAHQLVDAAKKQEAEIKV